MLSRFIGKSREEEIMKLKTIIVIALCAYSAFLLFIQYFIMLTLGKCPIINLCNQPLGMQTIDLSYKEAEALCCIHID